MTEAKLITVDTDNAVVAVYRRGPSCFEADQQWAQLVRDAAGIAAALSNLAGVRFRVEVR